MILLYIHHTFEMKFKLRGYLLFQSCKEGGVRLPVQRADQLWDAREEADPLRDEHAHSGPRVHKEVIRPTLVFCFNYDLLYWYYILIKHHTDITTSVIC